MNHWTSCADSVLTSVFRGNLSAAVRARHATLGPGRLETSGLPAHLRFSRAPPVAGASRFVAARARMSYFRDGHREPPDTQPASSSTGD